MSSAISIGFDRVDVGRRRAIGGQEKVRREVFCRVDAVMFEIGYAALTREHVVDQEASGELRAGVLKIA